MVKKKKIYDNNIYIYIIISKTKNGLKSHTENDPRILPMFKMQQSISKHKLTEET